MANKKTTKITAAIIGGNSLIGRELTELADGKGVHFDLIDGDLTGGTLALDETEALYLAPITEESLKPARAIFLAGKPESHVKARSLAPAESPVIDLTGALEDQPEARLRAPLVEKERPPLVRLSVIAHPAAIALTQLLRILEEAGTIGRTIAVIHEPASERGTAGIGELDKQTRGLLALRPLPKTVFDEQLAFNLLPQYGAEAVVKLEDIELRIERHLASLLAATPSIPMPSIRLVQAPVFHGYSFSIWTEFEASANVKELVRVLKAAGVDVRDSDTQPPSNVGTAQQSGLTVGAIRVDRNNSKAVWLWMVCDNLRVLAENALAVAQEAF